MSLFLIMRDNFGNNKRKVTCHVFKKKKLHETSSGHFNMNKAGQKGSGIIYAYAEKTTLYLERASSKREKELDIPRHTKAEEFMPHKKC